MGLDFSHTEVSWSYGNFNQARTQLAAAIGIDLDAMQGFGGSRPWPGTDDIELLLNHSDCDGELTPEECRKVAPRLRELVKDWSDDDLHKRRFLSLADGMDLAAEASESLLFI